MHTWKKIHSEAHSPDILSMISELIYSRTMTPDHLPPPAESPPLDMDSRRPTATSSRCTRLANSAIPVKDSANNGEIMHEAYWSCHTIQQAEVIQIPVFFAVSAFFYAAPQASSLFSF